MYEINIKESDIGNKNDAEVKFTKFVDEDEKKDKKKKNSKKYKNKSHSNEMKDEFKKSDENEYFSNKNMAKIIIDDDYNTRENINFKTAFSYFSSYEYKEEQEIVNKERNLFLKKKSFIKRMCECFYGGESQKVKTEKNLICCITKVKYNDDIDIHYKILSSIYIFFTNEKECPKKGEHWEKIGFQSNTPQSDLRSVGMLAPLQILYFLCAYPSFSISNYKLFCSKNCEWLFAVTLINITQICYHLLRDDFLNQFFKKNNEVITVFNELYVGIIYNLNQYLEENKDSLTAEYISECLEKIRKHSKTTSEIDAFLWNIKKIK